jgi:hypothetical protein
MTLELWNTVAAFGTLVVIAATAVAALVQLRHARAGYQIAGLAELNKAHDSPEFAAAFRFVTTGLANKLEDPEFRYQLFQRGAGTAENLSLINEVNLVGNYYENLGALVMTGLIDRKVALMLWDGQALRAWALLTPYLAVMRRRDRDIWLHFEYFVVLAEDWRAVHPDGVYPKNFRHIGIDDPLLEVDERYAVSRPSAS